MKVLGSNLFSFKYIPDICSSIYKLVPDRGQLAELLQADHDEERRLAKRAQAISKSEPSKGERDSKRREKSIYIADEPDHGDDI